jgi:hypothetical protein
MKELKAMLKAITPHRKALVFAVLFWDRFAWVAFF